MNEFYGTSIRSIWRSTETNPASKVLAHPLTIALVLSLWILMPGQARAGDAGDAEAGLAIAEKACAACHAITVDGDSPHQDAPPFAQVVQRYDPSSLEEALAEGIVTGHPDMPVFVFKMQEIEDFIAYLETLE